MTPVTGKPKSPNTATTPMISLENICSSSSKQIDPTVSIQASEDSKSRLNQLGSLSITRLMSGSSHILCVLIGFECQNCHSIYDVYFLFAILIGQMKSKPNYRFVTYKLASS